MLSQPTTRASSTYAHVLPHLQASNQDIVAVTHVLPDNSKGVARNLPGNSLTSNLVLQVMKELIPALTVS